MAEWISVNDRLPDKGTTVLISDRSRNIEIAWRRNALKDDLIYKGLEWYWNLNHGGGWVRPDGVTHWMPLPPVPGERKEQR